MNDRGRRISEMTTRLSGFGAMSVGDFPSDSVGGQRFNTLNELSTKFDLYGSRMTQEKNAARAATEAKATVLESVRRKMRDIRETALSAEAQQPGIAQNFNMPSNHSAESLIEAARAFVAAATPLKQLFLSREMPENFLEDLTESIMSYEEAVNNQNLHSANRAAAKSLLDDVCSQVLALRRELNPIVRNKYRNNPEKLALWETASHLEKHAQRRASAEPGNGNQSPATGQS